MVAIPHCPEFSARKYSPKKFVTLITCRFCLFGPEGNFSTFLRKSLTLRSCSSWKIKLQCGNLIEVLITYQELPLAAQLSGARPLGAPQAAGVISWAPPQVRPINCQNLKSAQISSRARETSLAWPVVPLGIKPLSTVAASKGSDFLT